MTLKKRITGFLLLIGGVLIVIPLFFGRSISSDELKLSAHVPTPPAKPKAITAPLPLRSTTVPEIVQASKPVADSNIASSVAFEQLGSTVPNASSSASMNSPANTNVLVNTNPGSLSASKVNTPVTVSLPARSTLAENTVSKPILPTHKDPKTSTARVSVPPSTSTQVSSVALTASPVASALVTASTPNTLSEGIPVVQSELVATKIPTKHKNAEAKPSKLIKPIKSARTPPVKLAQKASKLPVAPEAWSVQLGSFSSKTNAQKLMQNLQSKGFTAYLRTTKTTSGDFTRVLVGPSLQQSDAAQLQTRLQKEIDMQGVLVKVGRG